MQLVPLLLLLLLLQLQPAAAAAATGCTQHKTIACRDERVDGRSGQEIDNDHDGHVFWSSAAQPALRAEYHYTQDETFSIKLEAFWRISKGEELRQPVTGFEILLSNRTSGAEMERRRVTITAPPGGIKNLAETVNFAAAFDTSLEFGGDYDVELRFLPASGDLLFGGGLHMRQVTVPPRPPSDACHRDADSSLARDRAKYEVAFAELRKFPIASAVHVAFYTAPSIFCFDDYTVEVVDAANHEHVYGKVLITQTDSSGRLAHDFDDLPTDIYLAVKVYPTESADAELCFCAHCACLVTQSKPFMFKQRRDVAGLMPSPHRRALSEQFDPAAAPPASWSPTVPFLIALMALLVAMMAVITWLIRKGIMPQRERLNFVPDWRSDDEKAPIIDTIQSAPRRSGVIWVIGREAPADRAFLRQLSARAAPSSRTIFAPADLPDGVNRWTWMTGLEKSADLIICLLSAAAGPADSAHSSSAPFFVPCDAFEMLYHEQMGCLRPGDPRVITVALDDAPVALFQSFSEVIYRFPRDFLLLTQSLARRGFAVAPTAAAAAAAAAPAAAATAQPSDDEAELQQPPPRHAPLQPCSSSCSSGGGRDDSGYASNPSPPALRRPIIDCEE